MPLEFNWWALPRLLVAHLMILFGCLAVARTVCRLFPVSLDESAQVVPSWADDCQALRRPYGLLTLFILLAAIPLALLLLPRPILSLLVLSLILAWYRRARVRNILDEGSFFLYLRRFGAFRDQLVLGELLATVPHGAPVVIFAPIFLEFGSWDPLTITWKGVFRRGALWGGPFYVRSSDAYWVSSVEVLVSRAQKVILDVSDYNHNLDREYRAMIARKSPLQTVLVADINSDIERVQETLLADWKRHSDERRKEVNRRDRQRLQENPDGELLLDGKPLLDGRLLLQTMSESLVEIINPAWPLHLRLYGRSRFFGILRGFLTLSFLTLPAICWGILTVLGLEINRDLPGPIAFWFTLAIIIPVGLRVLMRGPLLFRRSVDLELRRIFREAFKDW